MSGVEKSEHYEIIPYKDGYSFHTDNDIWVIVKITSISTIIDTPYNDYVFEFSFETDRQDKEDPKVSNTISAILKIFFSNPNNILFYLCDSGDSKHHSRNRLFKRWFTNYADDSFTLIENQIINQKLDIEYLINAIIHKDNKYYEVLKSDLQKITDEFSSYK